MQHRSVLIMALETDRFVAMLARPFVDGFHQLRSDPLTAKFRQHAIKPGEEYARLQLESQEEADRPLVDARHHLQHIMAAQVTAVEELRIARGTEDLIEELDNLLQILWPNDVDNCVGHEAGTLIGS